MFLTAVSIFAVMLFIFALLLVGSFALVHGLVNSSMAIGARAIWVAVAIIFYVLAYSLIGSVPFPAD